MPVKYKAPPPASVCNWTGFYVRGNAGWVGTESNNISNTGTDTGAAGLGSGLNVRGAIPRFIGDRYDGFKGGGSRRLVTTGRWAIGSSASKRTSTAPARKSTASFVFPGSPLTVPLITNYTRELDWLATFRGRVGVLAAPSLLLYRTGGLAVGETKIGNQFVCPTCTPPASTQAGTVATSDNTSAGWTAGVSTEWMFAPKWSAKIEYLYVDLGRHSSTISYSYGAFNSTLTSTVRDTDNIVLAGVNCHFGGRSSPNTKLRDLQNWKAPASSGLFCRRTICAVSCCCDWRCGNF
jgi:outer membrane immunogenic protein